MEEEGKFGGPEAGKLGWQAMQESTSDEQRRLASVKGGRNVLKRYGKRHFKEMAAQSSRTSHLTPDERSAIAKKAVQAREKRRKRKKK